MRDKMLRLSLPLTLTLLLSACGVGNRQIMPPTLQNNEVIAWHYSCKQTYGLDVEYANMGGDYTATIYNEELSKRVLHKVAPAKFSDGEWEWALHEDNNFTLTQQDQVITSQCRSYSTVDNSGIVLLR